MMRLDLLKKAIVRLVVLCSLLLVAINVLLFHYLRAVHEHAALLMVGGCLVLSAGLIVCLIFSSRKLLRSWLSDQLREVMLAGDWALRHARGSAPLETGDAPAADPDPARYTVVAELEKWLGQARETKGSDTHHGSVEMRRDLELAKEFQQAYLNRPYPRVPEVHVEGRLRLIFSHRYEPALALGGDFFDIFTLAQDCAGVFVADVMGHGTRSALITAILRTLIGDLQHQGRNATHFLTELNKQFCSMLKTVPNPLFASAYYFVPDTTGRVATYSSAGHPAPFHVRSSLGRITRLEVPPPRGSALGLVPDETYSGGHVRLVPGDVFLFFTDGLYEAHNEEGEEFGITRMEEVIHKHIYRGGKTIANAIIEEAHAFAGNQPIADDICIVAVEVTDKVAVPDKVP
jgi:serine phosphatase RsbU (regulator of sigma subunit)